MTKSGFLLNSNGLSGHVESVHKVIPKDICGLSPGNCGAGPRDTAISSPDRRNRHGISRPGLRGRPWRGCLAAETVPIPVSGGYPQHRGGFRRVLQGPPGSEKTTEKDAVHRFLRPMRSRSDHFGGSVRISVFRLCMKSGTNAVRRLRRGSMPGACRCGNGRLPAGPPAGRARRMTGRRSGIGAFFAACRGLVERDTEKRRQGAEERRESGTVQVLHQLHVSHQHRALVL